MKKIQKKFLAIILLITMFLNIILPIAQAITTEPTEPTGPTEPTNESLVTEEDVRNYIKENPTETYAIYELEYEAYNKEEYKTNPETATAKRTYDVGDVVKVRVKIKETDARWTGLSQFQASLYYDINVLEPISKSMSEYDDLKYPTKYTDWQGNDLENGAISVNTADASNMTLKGGDWIIEMFFVAKKDSNTSTSIVMYNIISDRLPSGNAYSQIGNANTPTLTLPEAGTDEPVDPTTKITHGIEITKTDVAKAPITSSFAIYRIIPQGKTDEEEGKLLMTNASSDKNGKGLLNNLDMPLTLASGTTGTYTYTIKEIQAPDGYEIDATAKTLTLTFNETGEIKAALLDGIALDASSIDSTNNIVKLSFANEVKTTQVNSKVTFEITKVDENNQIITESPAVFGLTVAEGDVKNVITSGGIGRISVDVPDDISVAKVYTLNELTAPEGYVLNRSDIKISVEFERNGDNTVVKSVSKLEGDNATVTKDENGIKVVVTNEKEIVQEKFQIEITKVDENNVPITTGQATFSVTAPNGATYMGQTLESSGKVTIVGNIPTDALDPTGYTYSIQEIKAPTGYKINVSPINVKLVFAEVDGVRKVTSAEVNEVDKTSSLNGNTLPISIVNEKEPDKFTITLNKVDGSGNKITGAKSYFQLTAPSGEKTSLQIDAEGTAIYQGTMPETAGTVTYKLLEITAPDGYKRNDTEQTITLNFGKVSGVMTLKGATVTDPITKVSDTSNNLVINFKNESEVPVEKITEFDLSVKKIDSKSGATIETGTAIFQLLDEFDRNLGLFETKSGIATIKVALPETAGIVNYKLAERVAPAGYVLEETPKTISIEFEEVSGQMQVTDITVTGDNIRKESVTTTKAEVSFVNEAKPAVVEQKTFELIINKKDSSNTTANIKEENVVFVVTGPDGVAHTLRTDAEGKISLTGYMPEVAKKVRYELQEIKAPTGYVVYGTSQYVDITFEEVDGIMQIVDAQTSVSGEKIIKDFAGVSATGSNQVEVSVLNDKDVPITGEKFTININKVDGSLANIAQENVYFKVETTGEEAQLISTDNTGLAVFSGNIPLEAKTVTYTLTELTAPDGYVRNENDMTLNLVFTETEGKIALTSIIINEAQGVRKVGDVTNNTTEIKVINTLQEVEPEPVEKTTFTLKINKQDKESFANILQENVGFEIKKPDGTSAYVRTDALGVATYTDYTPDEIGNAVYTIKEVEGPEGYIKNENELIATLNFTKDDTGVMKLSGFEVTGEGIRKVSNATANTAEVAVDNERIPEVIPDPRYALILNKVDGNKEKIAEAGVSFIIIGVDGAAHSLETNEQGIISFSEVIPETAGTYPIKIMEMSAPEGYARIEKEMTINLTFRETSGEMVLMNVTIPNDEDKAFIEKISVPQNNKIQLRVINEKETENFTLKIYKKDKEDESRILPGAVFEVIAKDGTSKLIKADETGIATYIGKIPAIGNSEEYTLREVSAPEGYIKNLNDMTLTLSYGDADGKRTLTDIAVVESQGIRKIGTVARNVAEVAVDNEKMPDTEVGTEEKYGLRINKVNTDLENILQAGVSFELKDASGNKSYLATDENGVAVFTGTMPASVGDIVYTLKELNAPAGYVKNPNEMTITLTFDDSTGKIALTNITVGNLQGIEKVSGIEDNIAEVKVVNEVQQETENFTLKIHKQDKEEARNILQAGVVFEITAPDGRIAYVKTNAEGIATFEGIIPTSAANQVYKINEINAPTGYIKNENEMNITLSFTENSGIVSLNDVAVNAIEGVRKIGTVADNTAEVAVDNEKKTDDVVEEKYALKINKVDESLANIHQKGVAFKVTDIAGNVSYIDTDETGVAIFTGVMPNEANTYILKVLEVSGPDGYVKNPNEMTISAKFEEVNGKIELVEITITESEGIRKVGTVQDNIAEVKVINTKKVVRDEFVLGIEKVDAKTLNAIEQKDIIFKVEDNIGNYNFYATDAKGKLESKFQMPENAGTYTYYISEVVAPTGYLLNTNKIPVQATFIKTDGKVTLQKYTVDPNSSAKVAEDVTDGHSGYVQILNEKIEEEVKDTFAIELNKVDSISLENIKQSGVVFKVKEQNGKSHYLETNENGKITLTNAMPAEEGTVRYEIEEIRQPNGYKLLTEVQYVDITFSKVDGKMVITNAVTTGSKIKSTYGIEKVILSVLNDAEETVVDPEKPTFDLVINKVDSETLKNIEQAGVTFKVTSPENTVSNVQTTEEGIASLKLNVPETAGNYRYKLSEIVAPTGYDKNEKELYVDITFVKNNDKLEISDISVNNKNGIIAASFQADSSVVKVKNTKTQVKPEEPDKPTDTKPETPVFDVETDKYITNITMKYSDTNETIKRTVQNKDGVSKLDVKANRLKYLTVDIEYKIVAKNVGNKEGTLSSILDRIPSGLSIDLAKNKDWKVTNNIATYSTSNEVLKPGESKEATIVLSYSGKTGATGELINYATMEAIGEKDSDKPANTNNIDNATLILSIKTGQEWVVYPVITIFSLVIMALGVTAIKKYVL